MFGFGSSEKSSGFLSGGGNSSSNTESIIPTFEDKAACDMCCPDLTYQQRIIGYLSCAAVGYVLSFIGTLVLFGGFSADNIRLFAIFYVIGNIVSLCASGFLMGPKSQCKKMWDPSRRYSTAFYLSMIIVVFAVAVTKQNIFLILFLFVVQVIAGAWYSLSYIPFGRKVVLNFLRATGACYPCFAASDSIQECSKNSGGGGKGVFGGK